jgi:hypothetical protein
MLPSKGASKLIGANRCRYTKDAAASARALPQPCSQTPDEEYSQEETEESQPNISQCPSHVAVINGVVSTLTALFGSICPCSQRIS